jgi:eukaryotic-like serine/threonine-protein kinase
MHNGAGRGQGYGGGSLGRWPEAAKAAAEMLAIDPSDSATWYELPPLLLEIGDREGYVKACREMLERFGSTEDPQLPERTAKTCLLLPDAVGDTSKVARLATCGVTGTEKHMYYRWFVMCKALADYREGEYARTLAALEGLKPSPDGRDYDATVYAVMAMAHQRLSHGEEARQALQRARAIVERKMPKPERGQVFVGGWDNWLRCRILLREAEALSERKTEKQ